jgi:hypothetical protein
MKIAAELSGVSFRVVRVAARAMVRLRVLVDKEDDLVSGGALKDVRVAL